MRRRKGNRGRPKKVKRGRNAKPKDIIPVESKLSEEIPEEEETISKDDGAVTGFIGLDKTGPTSYRVGSVIVELDGADEDIQPVIQENDIMLEVECGSNNASMFLSRLCQGSKGSCIEFDGAWLTPNEFQFVSGRETAKDWKRSIRHYGRSLKLLITKGILTVHPAACRCDSCRLLSSTTTEPKLVKDKRARDLLRANKAGSDGSACSSEKEDGGDDDEEEKDSQDKESVEDEDGEQEDGSEDAEDEDEEEDGEESQESVANASAESGGEEQEEEETEGGKVEENNNEAEEKEESSESDGSSSSSSDSSDSSDSDSDATEVEDEKDKAKEEKVAEATSATVGDSAASEEPEMMESETTEDGGDGKKEEEEEEGDRNDNEDMDAADEGENEQRDDEAKEEDEGEEEDAKDDEQDDEETEIEDAAEEQDEENEKMEEEEEEEDEKVEDVETKDEEEKEPDELLVSEVEDKPVVEDMQTDEALVQNDSEKNQSEEYIENIGSINDSDTLQEETAPKYNPLAELTKCVTPEALSRSSFDSDGFSARSFAKEPSDTHPPMNEVFPQFNTERADSENDASLPVLPTPSKILEDDTSQGSNSNAPSQGSSVFAEGDRKDDPIAAAPKLSAALVADGPKRSSVERSNSTGGKSRLSNIIDLLRTSKEKETKKQSPPPPPVPEERLPERRPHDAKDVRTPPPLPPKREDVNVRKAERESPMISKQSKEEMKMLEKAREAGMRYPVNRLPFGFPPPDLLDRASREAHEALSKSHKQFEKNLEALIAQNMNPFIPELSIFSHPEQRAQMEYNYLKNMERLDQMAKERMATMAEFRHQQMMREHNTFVSKLAEQQKQQQKQQQKMRMEAEQQAKAARERMKEKARAAAAAPPPPKRSHPVKENNHQSPQQPKVPPAHRAQPEVRHDTDQRKLRTPPAAHGHHSTSRPPSAGSKPPSSLPLPASTGRAAHPTGPSATHSRSSPMVAPIAPPLQMWSSCFPYVIPPPTIEMQRLTQFFPNLNGGMFSPETGARRQTESPILDLSTKKRKMNDSWEHNHSDNRPDNRHKQPRLSSNSKSVHHSSPSNGHPRVSPHRPHHAGKDVSAKDVQSWSDYEAKSGASGCTCALQHLNDMRNWSVDDVCCFLKGLEGCSVYADTFRRLSIDGSTLQLLSTDTLTKSVGMKLTAAVFLTGAVTRRAKDLHKLVPCDYCRLKNQRG